MIRWIKCDLISEINRRMICRLSKNNSDLSLRQSSDRKKNVFTMSFRFKSNESVKNGLQN
jgi:hypothetical protein